MSAEALALAARGWSGLPVRAGTWARRCFAFLLCATGMPGAAAFEVGADIRLAPTTYADVSSATELPDGRIVITGDFDRVGGLRRRSIAVLHPDGTVDGAFGVDCSSSGSIFIFQPCVISRVLAAPDGSLLVSGDFREIGGLPREGVAKLDARTGAVDPLWRPVVPAGTVLLGIFGRDVMLGSSGLLRRVSLDDRGQAIATPVPASYSTTHNGRDAFFFVRNEGLEWRVRRTDAVTGAVDPDWHSRGFAAAPVLAYDPQQDVLLVAGRAPGVAGGVGSDEIVAMVEASGPSVERAWWLNSLPYAPGPMFVSNDFLYVIGGTNNPRVRRYYLRHGGALDSTYVSTWAGNMRLLGVDATGRPLLHRHGHWDEEHFPPAGSTLLRLTATGALDVGFLPFPRRAAAVSRLSRAPDGSLVLHGEEMTAVDSLMVRRLARTHADLTLDHTWAPRVILRGSLYFHTLRALAQDSAGWTYYSTTWFDDGGGSSAPALDRLGQGARRDATWNDSGYVDDSRLWRYDQGIFSMLVDEAAGWLYLGGSFDAVVCGQRRRNLVRVSLASPCAADPAWQPEPDGAVTAMTLDPLGRLYVGGSFENIAGQPVLGLARFDAGVLDGGWRPLMPGPGRYSVQKLAATTEAVFAGLSFAPTGGLPSQGLVRFDARSGLYAMDWRPRGADEIADMLITESGHLVASRRGLEYPGGRNELEAFQTDGTGQPVARLVLESGQRVDSLVQGREPDAVIVAGRFDALRGEPRSSIAELLIEPRSIFADGFQ